MVIIASSPVLKIRRISGDSNTDEIIVSVLKSRIVGENSPLEDLILGQFLLCRYETDVSLKQTLPFLYVHN